MFQSQRWTSEISASFSKLLCSVTSPNIMKSSHCGCMAGVSSQLPSVNKAGSGLYTFFKKWNLFLDFDLLCQNYRLGNFLPNTLKSLRGSFDHVAKAVLYLHTARRREIDALETKWQKSGSRERTHHKIRLPRSSNSSSLLEPFFVKTCPWLQRDYCFNHHAPFPMNPVRLVQGFSSHWDGRVEE